MLRSKDAMKLFTSHAISSLAKNDFSILHKTIQEYLVPNNLPVKISELFDLTLSKISKDYKGEYFYKNVIAQKLFLNRHGEKATMLAEFRVGANKADCLILNGISTCYEIKTEFDTLNRLPEQLSSYTKIFDKVFVICANKHLDKICALLPKNVGLLELTERGAIKEVIKANMINTSIDRKIMMQSLRVQEYKYIVEVFFETLPKMKNTEIFDYCLDKFYEIPSDKLRVLFRETLKKYRANDFNFIKQLPNSLISSAICYNITKNEQNILLDILNKYIDEENICTFQSCEVNRTN
ncbi:sce7726 family protein [Gilliamella sp. WF3-4]|uniref:sce7726 family protein n=1 Tax=Gilliamella sp. WF3-4 TaxID=3120255 RepID=UPI00080DBFE5|nr:sce7726 family protein [Gilliamella apicola]OCG14864.1 hypothetical protein A9G47_03050 [Gilliamella apicola]